jgi:hypothetical protein
MRVVIRGSGYGTAMKAVAAIPVIKHRALALAGGPIAGVKFQSPQPLVIRASMRSKVYS